MGLVGRNGTGKTTLLRVLLGEHSHDAGEVSVRTGVRIGYLPQHAVAGSSRPLWDEARSGMTRLLELEGVLARAQVAVQAGTDGAIARYDQAAEAFRLAGGWAADERVGEVLHGLGFRKDDWQRPCDTFSGGWQMRIALARLLLADADLLLLDEPTNHLDVMARTWLARELAASGRTLLIVSHDRHLLDRVTTRTVEVAHRTLYVFSGPLSGWMREREERLAHHEARYRAQQEEIARLERFVDRFRAKATKAAQARSRQKRLDRMERLDAPEREVVPRYRLPEPPAASQVTLHLVNASAGWDGQPVFSGLDLELQREMRVAVLGPNGCGKSTLLGALSGRLSLLAGRRRVGEGARIGVFSQDLATQLPLEETGLEVLQRLAPQVATSRAWSLLGALGLTGDRARQPVRTLSGGERARVALASLAVRPYAVLLLDEPTNHLDALTVEVLTDALRGWTGTLVLVTHDRFAVEQVATHVLRWQPDGWRLTEGVRTEDFEHVQAVREESSAQDDAGAEAWRERKRRARDVERARRRVVVLEDEIAAFEEQVAALDARLFEVTDYARSEAIASEQRELQGRIEALMTEWEELAEV